MCQLAIENIAEDLGVSVRVGGEAGAACYPILVQYSQTSEVLELGVVVVCKAEGVVGVEPSVVSMTTLVRSSRDNFGVRESFRHGVLDCVDSCHRFLD